MEILSMRREFTLAGIPGSAGYHAYAFTYSFTTNLVYLYFFFGEVGTRPYSNPSSVTQALNLGLLPPHSSSIL